MKTNRPAVLLFLFSAICVCSSPGVTSGSSPVDMISAGSIRGHVYFLASDALEGRYVGSGGYEIAARYGESQFKAAGLAPVNRLEQGDSYLQEVPSYILYI